MPVVGIEIKKSIRADVLNKAIDKYADKIREIVESGTAVEYTWMGLLAAFVHEVEANYQERAGSYENVNAAARTDVLDAAIFKYADEISRILELGTAVEYTWMGLLASFVHESEGNYNRKVNASVSQ